jgi:hypothetical protein
MKPREHACAIRLGFVPQCLARSKLAKPQVLWLLAIPQSELA